MTKENTFQQQKKHYNIIIRINSSDLFFNLAQFHQRLSDETFGKILAEEFKKQIIAVSHWDRV